MSNDPLRLRWIDLVLIPLIPVIIEIGTAIHEGSHALVMVVLGIGVKEFSVLPSATSWGHVLPIAVQASNPAWIATMVAPYVTWLIVFVAAWRLLGRRPPRRRWIAVLIAMGLAAPVVDAIANYDVSGGDARNLVRLGFPVHAFFIVVLSIYVAGLVQLAASRRGEFGQGRVARTPMIAIPAACAIALTGSLWLSAHADQAEPSVSEARVVKPVADVPRLLHSRADDLAAALAPLSRPGTRLSKDEFEGRTYWRTETAVGRLDVTEVAGKVTVACLTFSRPTPEARALMWTGLDPRKLRRARVDEHAYDGVFEGVRTVYVARERTSPRVTSIWISGS